METLTTGIQAVSVVGLIFMLAACIYLGGRWKDVRGLVIPPALWATYGVVFYTFVLTGRLSGVALLLWGAIHRMLGIYMLLGGLVALWAILTAPVGSVEDDGGDDTDE